jgi:hypothetical protein|tara:strand:+ start:518 stop:718 length:201 start_codon:yes stop_codon:yes gene_type:complete
MNKPLIEIAGGVERHHNGSFTMFGTIEGQLYKQTYYDYTLDQAHQLFKKSIQEASELVFINQTGEL